MEYSPINKVSVRNFRNLEQVDIDFSDSGGIVALTGANDSGKSSVIRAIGVALDNMWYAKQSKFIRTDTQGFGVRVTFDDGSSVTRRKTDSVNNYTAKFANGGRRVSEKLMAEAPDFVQGLAGFFRDPETGECLNLRTYSNKLLFVGTTDGENYKIFQNAVNNLDVREAVRQAKSDLSELTQNIVKAEAAITTLKEQRDKLVTVDPQYISMVAHDLERAVEASKLWQAAVNRLADLEGLRKITRFTDFEPVNIDAALCFDAALGLLDICGDAHITDLSGVAQINENAALLFDNALKCLTGLSELKVAADTDALESIDTKAYDLLVQSLKCLSDITALTERVRKADAAAAKHSEALKAAGTEVVVCEKCGNEIIIDRGMTPQ